MRGTLMLLCGGLFAVSLSAGDGAKKLPIPDKAAQAKALALVLDIFKEDMEAAREPEAKAKQHGVPVL